MTKRREKPDTEKILGQLKDFQRQTVDYVFRRMYTDPDATKRFLIADEVGLGKTLVARGLIARAVDYLWDTIDRIDIVYICANLDIARQNINRLNITGQEDVAVAKRMTMLPAAMHKLHGHRINFVSFTPGTSFNLRSSSGIQDERALIYHMLRGGWRLRKWNGIRKILQCSVKTKNWRYRLRASRDEEIDEQLAAAYLSELDRNGLKERLRDLARKFAGFRRYIPDEASRERYELVGELRSTLAHSCVEALEPDIVILDEFQRFRDLLTGDNDAAQLARAVFDYPDAKVILLSATPYKMYTMHHEREQEDHYGDFLKTVGFLLNRDGDLAAFQGDLARFRRGLLDLRVGEEGDLPGAKKAIEARLRKVMVRTERLGATADRSGMICESRSLPMTMAPHDLEHFVAVDRMARCLDVGDTVEYWKSAPYLLNVMDRDGYKIKRELLAAVKSKRQTGLSEVTRQSRDHLLRWPLIKRYAQVEPANAKLRALLQRTVECGAWKLLWVPPSMPYYQAAGPYADPSLKDFTKALVFSSWLVVPKVIAMLCSYEAERRMVRSSEENPDYEATARRRRNLLRFAFSDDRLTGMSNFALLYPCLSMAAKIDPAAICADLQEGGDMPTAEQLFARVREQLSEMLEPVMERFAGDSSAADESWYWAGPVLMDRFHCRAPLRRWLDSEDDKVAWESMVRTRDESEGRFAEHVEELRCRHHGMQRLGRPPDDLLDILTRIALASPAVVALRSLLRVCRLEHPFRAPVEILAAAAKIAMGFRSLFNLPQSVTVVRSLRRGDDESYWQAILDYCADGNLQAVMDEYMHVLRESLGLIDKPPEVTAAELAEEIHSALSLQTVSLSFDEIKVGADDRISLDRYAIRCRYALRFGDARGEEEKAGIRKEVVRKAFNSPFRPFVLASTSIGQEGLDFHQYCHQIFHWNLPANPVDLEQREGRIHRYKGHVIRRNVARDYPLSSVAAELQMLGDPWEIAFEMARKSRPLDVGDLVPYWIYESPGGHKVYRHIPALPLSRDLQHLDGLRESLVAYRLVLGQPRQEDLVSYLRQRFGAGTDVGELLDCRIDLRPT